VAEDYTAEFEEMFTGRHFGAESLANTPYPTITIGDDRLEVFFSPDDGTAGRLEAILRSAQESINFLAFSFTSDNLGSAILDRAQSGVAVAGVMDESQVGSNQGTEYSRFRKAGLDVRKDGLQGNLHDKVLIIDHKIVVTGSYNFSRNAEETNDENTLIIYDAEIARLFIEHFEKIYDEAKQ
jgi:phosphatidylserine/phosphatidylglycerophosphate/cardiolipin synthase-like enzyme